MKLTKKEASVLNSITRYCLSKPILINALYRQENGGTISATNLETLVEVHNVGNGIKEDSLLIPMKLIGNVEYEGNRNQVIAGSSKFTTFDDLKEYPEVEQLDMEHVSMGCYDLEDFRSNIEYAFRAVATEPTRYAINSVKMEYGGAFYRFIATDGKRLHISGDTSKSKERFEVMINRDMVDKFLKLTTNKTTGYVKVAKSKNIVEFIMDTKTGKHERDYRIIGLIVEGHYPEWRDVLPTQGDSFEFRPDKEFITLLKDSWKMVRDSDLSKATIFTCDTDTIMQVHTECRETKQEMNGAVLIHGKVWTGKRAFQSCFFAEALVVDEPCILYQQKEVEPENVPTVDDETLEETLARVKAEHVKDGPITIKQKEGPPRLAIIMPISLG